MHKAPKTVSTLISACRQSRLAIALIVTSVRSRLVIARYPLAVLGSCVKAMMMLAPIPRMATPNHTSSTFGRTLEAHMAILRLVAKTTVAASHANGSFGADIEKNTVTMSRSKTIPKRPSILVRSRSLSRSCCSGGRSPSLTGRPHPSTKARYTFVAIDQLHRNLPLEFLRRGARLACLLDTVSIDLWRLLRAARVQEVHKRR